MVEQEEDEVAQWEICKLQLGCERAGRHEGSNRGGRSVKIQNGCVAKHVYVACVDHAPRSSIV
jgi:hypothetical protein